jgi:hypothetical protein
MLASAPESREELTSGTSYSPPPAFGRFKLLHQIGAGVLGPVFRTHDPEHERLVAVKAFTLDLTPEQASALASEFERLAALEIDAPCAAAPVAAGVEDYVPYVAVPYVSGESLDAAIRQYGPAPAGDAIRLIAHVAEALDAAAHAGVHHGSLHPRDIIVTPGETHVTGLGVAQALERVGLHGPVRRPYVAPERESGDEWGAPADVYSLAAIAYEVLTGRRALPGTDQPLPALGDLHVHDAAALRDVIESALDAEPARRPARARDFAAAFAAALSESAAVAAPGERMPDRRARKPRTRPPKLPGLDEPLAPQDAAVKGRAKAVPPVVPVPAAPDVPPAPLQTREPEVGDVAVAELSQAAEPIADIRYVPVIDPTDAGESAPDLTAPSSPPPEVRLEPDAAPEGGTAAPETLELPAASLASGFTPDLRLADELLPRADASGETVDAELAAALDRLSSEHGAGPTPAIIGLDILGPGPSARSAAEDFAAGGVDYDLAAETQLGYHVAEETVSGVSHPPSLETAEGRAGIDDFALDFGAPEKPPAQTLERAESPSAVGGGVVEAPAGPDVPAEPVPGAASEAEPEAASEPLRPFARGKGAERRRPPSRYSRVDTLTPTPDAPAGEEAGVPRAFEQARPTPVSRPAPDFELLTRPDSSRRPVFPVVSGVVVGMILGLAAGYWLGTRNAAPAPPSAQAVPSGRPAAGPAETTLPAAPQPAGAVPAETATPAAAPPAPSESATLPPAAAVRGAIEVTATEQANVFLDGERKGMTPRNLRNVPLGSHTIRVTRPGYAPQEQTIVLTAEEPKASMTFTLRRGSAASAAAASPAAGGTQAPAVRSVLTVLIESTPPGARIRINGRDLGPAPLTVRQLRPGTHTLELRLPGYKPWSQRLTVSAGDNRRVTATLERDNTR